MSHLAVGELLVSLLPPFAGNGNLLDVVDKLLLMDRDSSRRVLTDPESGLLELSFLPGCPPKCLL